MYYPDVESDCFVSWIFNSWDRTSEPEHCLVTESGEKNNAAFEVAATMQLQSISYFTKQRPNMIGFKLNVKVN